MNKKLWRDKDWLYQKYIIEGKSAHEISTMASCTDNTIRTWLRKYDIPIRNHAESMLYPHRKSPWRDKGWLWNQYITQQKSTHQIGEEIGADPKTIYKWLTRYNIQLRTGTKAIRAAQNNGRLPLPVRITLKCETCGESFSVVQSRRDTARFCSKDCRGFAERGSNSPSWKGGISNDPYPFEFNDELKQEIRERGNYTCGICQSSGNHVHHINYIKDDCRKDNLITLCPSCHSVTNYDREFWIVTLSNLIGGRERAYLS